MSKIIDVKVKNELSELNMNSFQDFEEPSPEEEYSKFAEQKDNFANILEEMMSSE